MRRRIVLVLTALLVSTGLVVAGSPAAHAGIGDSVSSPSVFSATNDSSGGVTITHTSASTYTFTAWSYNRFGNVASGDTHVRWGYDFGGPAYDQHVYSGPGAGTFNSVTWTVPAFDPSGKPLLLSTVVVGDWAVNPSWGTAAWIYPLP